MTIVITENNSNNESTTAVQIEPGRYMLGVSGTLGGATVQFRANLGPVDAPIVGASYTAEAAELVWLPRCTLYTAITGGTAASISAVVAAVPTDVV